MVRVDGLPLTDVFGLRSDESTDMEGVEEHAMETNRQIYTVQGIAGAWYAWGSLNELNESAP